MGLLTLINVRDKMKLKDNELILVAGGAISSQLINAFVRLVTSVVEIGRMIGTTNRRVVSGNYCK